MMGISDIDWPGDNCETISGHCTFIVTVMNRDGFPYSLQSARKSATWLDAQARLPIKEDGSVTVPERYNLRSGSKIKASSLCSSSCFNWKEWPDLMYCSLFSSTLENMSTRYSFTSWPNIWNRGSVSNRILYHWIWLIFPDTNDAECDQPGVPWGNKNGYCRGS